MCTAFLLLSTCNYINIREHVSKAAMATKHNYTSNIYTSWKQVFVAKLSFTEVGVTSSTVILKQVKGYGTSLDHLT